MRPIKLNKYAFNDPMAAIRTNAVGTTVMGFGPISAKPAGRARTPDPTMDLTKEMLRFGTVVDPSFVAVTVLLVPVEVLRSLESACVSRGSGDVVATGVTCSNADEEVDDEHEDEGVVDDDLLLDDFSNNNDTKEVGRFVTRTANDENANVEDGNNNSHPPSTRTTSIIILLLLLLLLLFLVVVKHRVCDNIMFVIHPY